MFILIMGLLGFIFALISLIKEDGWSGGTLGVSFLVGLMCSAIAFIVAVIVCACTPQSAIGEVNRTETQLITLKDNMAVDGYCGRYVYRGYIEEELQYTYLYEEKDKGITSGHCDADKTYINYTNETEMPKLIAIEYGVIHPIWKFFSMDGITGYICNKEYYLYVPEGSIIAEGQYEVDLE